MLSKIYRVDIEDSNQLEFMTQLEKEEAEEDVIVDDYKDLEIETMASSRKRFLQWSGLDD